MLKTPETTPLNASHDGPRVQDLVADQRFRQKIRDLLRGDPDSIWHGGYVDHVWEKCREPLVQYLRKTKARRVLEFGCNIGATSVVLAHLGVKVDAVDIDRKYIDIAQENAARYGFSQEVRFSCHADSTVLPWEDETFDFIVCNSVLEYVPFAILPAVLSELGRVLAPGGILFVAGTSNRLSPIEIHSRRWFINYLPRRFGPAAHDVERGLFPWEVLRGFPGYAQLDVEDRSRTYFDWKKSSGMSAPKRAVLNAVDAMSRPFGLPVALLLPSFSTAVRKPA
ncbi:class I SAM-dependent methyltransferase [Hydrogenophaga sp.]|uniref:class I SAM-dependent methyltransferase n=1 Tax=Hydrogenophaga sp. TaxID=1904254 RepID=UPI002FCC1DE5